MYESMLCVIAAVLYCLIPLFILYQAWMIVKYLHHRYILKETPPVPLASFVIFFIAVTLFAISVTYVINTSP